MLQWAAIWKRQESSCFKCASFTRFFRQGGLRTLQAGPQGPDPQERIPNAITMHSSGNHNSAFSGVTVFNAFHIVVSKHLLWWYCSSNTPTLCCSLAQKFKVALGHNPSLLFAFINWSYKWQGRQTGLRHWLSDSFISCLCKWMPSRSGLQSASTSIVKLWRWWGLSGLAL